MFPCDKMASPYQVGVLPISCLVHKKFKSIILFYDDYGVVPQIILTR